MPFNSLFPFSHIGRAATGQANTQPTAAAKTAQSNSNRAAARPAVLKTNLLDESGVSLGGGQPSPVHQRNSGPADANELLGGYNLSPAASEDVISTRSGDNSNMDLFYASMAEFIPGRSFDPA